MQFAFLAQSPREMALTDRILPRYFLSRVRVSIRPRFFLYAKKPHTRPNQPAARSHASAPPTVRTAQFETQIIPSRQVATYVRGGRIWMILLAPMQNHPSKKKLSALQQSSEARQRMRSIREEATTPGANTPLTVQVGLGKNCER